MKTTKTNNSLSKAQRNQAKPLKKSKAKRELGRANDIYSPNNAKGPAASFHGMSLRGNALSPRAATVLPEKSPSLEENALKEDNSRHLVKMLRELGHDVFSGEPLSSRMLSAFGAALPYIFIQAETEENGCVYLDGQEFIDRSKELLAEKPDVLLNKLFKVPVKKLVFISLVPWEQEPHHQATIERNSKENFSVTGVFLALLGPSQSGWSRGVMHAQSSIGLGMPKDKGLANFLFLKATPQERTASLDAALAHASHSMPPQMISFLLAEGAHPPPCVQSDKFLPLTTAAKAGQIETVKLLLEAGADPRQTASWSHGTALAWSTIR